MDYKIVFFDIDGTLVNDDKEMPQSAVDAIQQLRANGTEAVIATGRAPYFFQSIAERLGIQSYVCLNGGVVTHEGKRITDYPISKKDLEPLVQQAESSGYPLVFEGVEKYFANTRNHPGMLESIGSLKVQFPGYNPEYWKEESVYQAFLHCAEGEEDFYRRKFPNLRFVRWHPYAVDVMPLGGSKARGIFDLLRTLNLEPAQAVAFGDSLNDREMLSAVGLGIAMGNAVNELKPYADYVTAPVDEDGIVQGLKTAGLI